METGNIGLKPTEKTGDPFVLTRKSASGPISFFNNQKNEYNEKKPAPIYLPLDDLNFEKSFKKEDIFNGFKIDKNGSFKVTDEDIADRQKGVLGEIVKNMGTKILSGKKIVGLSLPVRIFEPRSMIERILDVFHFFPHFLSLASQTTDTVERIKYIITSIISSISHSPSQLKPFNPLLGETFEGELDKETKIYAEHISHHPAISFINIVSKNWNFYGQWTYNAEIGMNKIEIFNEGWMTLEFQDHEKFKIMFPNVEMKGVMIGSSHSKHHGSIVVIQEEKNIKGILKIGEKGKKGIKSFFTSHKSDKLTGGIFFYDKEKIKKLYEEDWLNMMKNLSGNSHLLEQITEISGSWLNNITFDKKIYWSFDSDEYVPRQQKFVKNPLPSDCRFREDLIWLFYGNENYSQEWKLALEAQQREDRENRKKYKK